MRDLSCSADDAYTVIWAVDNKRAGAERAPSDPPAPSQPRRRRKGWGVGTRMSICCEAQKCKVWTG